MTALAALLPLLVTAAPTARGAALVDVSALVPDAVVDLRYATAANFLGRAVYPPDARCLVRADVAARLARAAERLRTRDLRLRLYDCYRPLAVQREMWRLVPRRGWVADPRHGSNHNRAAAVDVGLSTADGREAELPTAFDAFEPRARADAAAGIPSVARVNRDLLRAAMEAEGFRVNRAEWWHFDAPEARGAPILDVPLAPAALAGSPPPRP
ncbi:M15 family metallopeptidase [Anaeromyxobacter oryzae]|uniref:D-alanyl-D-alanine dipeptidase n=1 Tax=Anaeromyxobacter oryzae TaxID=2918170 RepID=A0ABM7WTD1_9BACT|nr:M15 family metallopeptidase [Anaeromyxobacter oryzae]BDG02740.1 D-alanyl-D-alanine dipeptidase [Anaeromyxobacter oryzae]